MYYRVIMTAAGLALAARPLFRGRSQLPCIKGIIETKHYLPGRMRLAVPSLVENPQAAEMLKEQLGNVDPVESAQVNPLTGSVLIHFDPMALEPMILFGAIARILGLDEMIDSRQPALWRGMKNAGRAVDRSVFANSSGIVDTKTLVTLAIMGTLIYRLAYQRQRFTGPGTATLIWWFFNLIFMRRGIP